MKHFGSLLKRLRGGVPLREIKERTGLSPSYLSKVERGEKVLREERARQILQEGFGMGDQETDRALIEVSLEDHGLQDAELRRLVADLIQGAIPSSVRRRIVTLYRSVGKLKAATRARGTGSRAGKPEGPMSPAS